jgi:hypothetical protein
MRCILWDAIVYFLCGTLLTVTAFYNGTIPKKELIKRGVAYYHPTTAEFTWKTESEICQKN